MIASQYFLPDIQFNMAFIYDCHTTGEILSPIDILDTSKMHCLNMGVFHNISWNFQSTRVSGMHP